MEDLIEVRNLTKTFKQDFWSKPFVALSNVSFGIKKGEVTGFLGANGAGKSTTLKLIMSFIQADSGIVQFNEKYFSKGVKRFEKIGFLPERPFFYQHLTGRQFLTYMAKLNNVKQDEIGEKIQLWCSRLKIEFALNRLIRGYSKGMLQRLGFASCLIHDPDLIILDEPLSGLDPIGRREFKDIIVDLKNDGKTIFFSSHIINDVEEVCSEIVLLKEGQLVYAGKMNELIEEHERKEYEIQLGDKLPADLEKFIVERRGSKLIVNKENVNKLLGELVERDIKIFSLVKESPKLEEIVFEQRN